LKTMTANAAFREIASDVEKIKNDDRAVIGTMSSGDVVVQGDVYLVCLDAEPTITGPANSRQLAPGTTQGSRHIVVGECDVLTVDADSATEILNRLIPATKPHDQFIGPLVRAPRGCEVTHPEHGDRVLPAGTYLAVFQRSYLEQEVRRTQD
jgi:hypothetical protein